MSRFTILPSQIALAALFRAWRSPQGGMLPPGIAEDLAQAVQAIAPVIDVRDAADAKLEPRDPDYSREGRQGRGTFFCNHNCYRCKDGELPCVTKSGICQYPHARND